MPTPLHPAIVHFPIALVVLLPIVALVTVVAMRGAVVRRSTWLPVVALAAALSGSAWLALETGEAEEEAVEAIVARSAIHEHEERAELFLILTGGLLALAAGGLAPGRAGRALRVGTVAGAVVVAVFGFRVGHSGGELVYVHGAGAAYATAASTARGGTLSPEGPDREEDGHARGSGDTRR